MMHLIDQPIFKVPRQLDMVTFEVTTQCNLHCAGCIRTIESKEGHWKNNHMPAERFARIVNNLPPIKAGIMHGVGEPTLNPEYHEICRIARASGKFQQLNCNTNGLAHDLDYYSKVAEYLDFIIVSVDTLNQNFVEVTRSGTDVDKLRTRIAGLHERKLRFLINMVASRANFLDIPSTLKILNNIGPMHVNINPFQDFRLRPDVPSAAPSIEDWQLLRRILSDLKPMLPNLSVIISPGMGERLSNAVCDSPALKPAVTCEGYLTPCCVEWDPGVLGYASLEKHSFAEIWSTAAVRSYFHNYLEVLPDVCISCAENGRQTPTDMHTNSSAKPSAEEVLLLAVGFSLRIGDLEQAESICRSSLTKQSASNALFILGQVLVMRGKAEEALKVANQVISLIGDTPQTDELRNSAIESLRIRSPSGIENTSSEVLQN